MITTSEIHRAAASEGIRFDQTEKDYIILWILYGLSQPDLLPSGWVFKGGTCLRHCYYPGYRFSEDLDFTCRPGGKDLDDAQRLLPRVAAWIQQTSGIHLQIKAPRTIPGDFQVEFPVEYSRGGSRRQKLPHVKIHLTFDEPLVTKSVLRLVKPQYSDLSKFKIAAYTKRDWNKDVWENLLGSMMKRVPEFDKVWRSWIVKCHKILR